MRASEFAGAAPDVGPSSPSTSGCSPPANPRRGHPHRLGAAARVEWLRHQVVRIGGGVAITTRDITKRKRSEVQLRNSEQRLNHRALEAAGDELWDWGPGRRHRGFFTRGRDNTTPHLLRGRAGPRGPPRRPRRPSTRLSVGTCPEGTPRSTASTGRARSGGYRWVLGRGRLVARDGDGQVSCG